MPLNNRSPTVIGDEMQAAVAVEIGELEVDVVDRLLHRQDVVIGALLLVLVELRGIEVGHPEGRCQERRLAWIVGNLELAERRAGDEADPQCRIDDGRDVAEAALLLGEVMDRLRLRRRILDPEAVGEVTAGEEIFGDRTAASGRRRLHEHPRRRRDRGAIAPDGAAVFVSGRERVVAAAIDADACRRRRRRPRGS